MNKTLSFTVPKQCDNLTCRTFLRKECQVSARMITRLVRTEMGITSNGIPIKTIDRVHSGDIITLKLPSDNSGIVPTRIELKVVFEDDHILIVDKPAGIPVHPTKNYQTDTLANAVRFYSLQKNEDYTFRVINRLDRNTTGLVVIAKDKYTASKLSGMYKEYTAVCEGRITADGTVCGNIRLCTDSKIKREVHPDGARAITHYHVIYSNEEYTMIVCTLETGRTHQIRCHMSSIGYPLAGDDMYGGSLKNITRQALHCSKVRFVHPVTGEKIEITSKIPSDIVRIMNYFS